MLPGPVLVGMVTKTGGIFLGGGGVSRDRGSLGADWSDAPSNEEGVRQAGSEGKEMMSQARGLPDGRDPQLGRLQAHTDTMGTF